MLKVTGLTVHYGAIEAVREFSFEVQTGQVVAIIGANGAGKSTTLNTLGGLIKPRSGRIELDGRDITGLRPDKVVRLGLAQVPEGREVLAMNPAELHALRGNEIAVIFQEPMTALNPVMTIGTQIVEAIRLHRVMTLPQAREQAVEASGGVWMLPPDPEAFGVVDPEDAAWLRARCTPHPISTYEDRLMLKAPVGAGLPVTYIAVKPHYGPGQASRAYARSRPDWTYQEIEAGHDAMVTSPGLLAETLLHAGGRA